MKTLMVGEFAGFENLERVRAERERYEVSSLQLLQVTELGVRLRRLAAEPESIASAAQVLTSVLFDSLVHEGAPALALVRTYVTRPLGELDATTRRLAEALAPEQSLNDDVRCLTLAATRGCEPAWNDVASSRGHRVMPLPSAEAVARLPMVHELVKQLGLQVSQLVGPSSEPIAQLSQRAFSSFFVADAEGSPHIPAQAEFVAPQRVASVFGFGGVLPNAVTFAVIAFSRAKLDAGTARLFELMALHAKLSFLQTRELERSVAAPVLLQVKNAVLEQLLEQHESRVGEWADELTQALEETRETLHRLARIREQELTLHNEQLRSAQGSMLTMIEELRDARAGLEEKVALRTRELEIANVTLIDRNRELEEFAYIASHDLQEPLRTVSGHLQILQRRYKGKLDSDADDFIGFAVDGARRMQALIESLLLYSRVSSHGRERRRIKLDAALDAALENLALSLEESKAQIERQPLPELDADQLQMTQLLQNLIGNAIKFAGDQPPRIAIGAERDEERGAWRIEVRDHGVGFNPQYADRIFKIFKRLQRDKPGTGIGLAICKKIVQRHGGQIGARSEPQQGSTFFFSIPGPAYQTHTSARPEDAHGKAD